MVGSQNVSLATLSIGRDAVQPQHEHSEPDATVDAAAAARHALSHIETVLATISQGPVSPMDPLLRDVEAWLAPIDFERPMDSAVVIDDLVSRMTSSGVHTTHPRYFGLFNPTPLWTGVAGDIIAAGLNPQLAAHSHAPAAVELERHVLQFVRQRAGLPEGTHGSFTSGGSEANHTAMIVALTYQFPGFNETGVTGSQVRPVLYASSECHLAWLKIAHACGIGRAAVRLVPVDAHHRMDVDALRRMCTDDTAAGLNPFMVVGTAGTTGVGAIDPLDQIAYLSHDLGLHFHVDAAWAGALVLSDRLRPILAGIERADSVTIDAHKWMSVPMGAGMVFHTNSEAVADSFHVATSYMPSRSALVEDPYTSSMQWSRRAIGLKLYVSLAVHGREGYERQLEHDVRLGEYIAACAEDSGWLRINTTRLPVICVVDPEADSENDSWLFHSEVVDHVVASGTAWVSAVRAAGQAAIRICVTSHKSTEADVDVLMDALNNARLSVQARTRLSKAERHIEPPGSG